MSITNPRELRKFLEANNVRAKKALSQNFLIDSNIVNKIVLAAEIVPDDIILEIGPGPGALTELLLSKEVSVLAVEKDRFFAASLSQRLNNDKLTVFEEDILQFDLEQCASSKPVKVIANLPYNLTTPILQRLLPRHDIFSRVVVMVQDEVAQRIVANPGNKTYGAFTVFVNFYTTPKYEFTISNKCFYPQPKVSSAIVSFDLHAPPEVEDDFFTMTRTAFAQRRKMMRSTLKKLYPNIEEALTALNLNPQARPEELSLQDFIKLSSKLVRS